MTATASQRSRTAQRLHGWVWGLFTLLFVLFSAAADQGLGADGALKATPPSRAEYLYTGEQIDPDLGMYYLRARYYQPATGRFWTMDSFEGRQGEPLSLHKSLYGNGNPVNNIDPSGHESIGVAITSISIQIGFRASQIAAAHPIYTALGGIAVSVAFPQLEAIPPGHPSPLDEMGQVGRIIRQGIAKGIAKLGTPNRHHPLPKFLGGFHQLPSGNYITLPRNVHEAFHKLLHERLQAKGFPLGGLGGAGNSADDWANHFRTNPGSQEKAFEAVLEASRAIDLNFGDEIAKTGTTLTQAVWKNIIEGKFTSIP